jgi:hypothetical protein
MGTGAFDMNGCEVCGKPADGLWRVQYLDPVVDSKGREVRLTLLMCGACMGYCINQGKRVIAVKA